MIVGMAAAAGAGGMSPSARSRASRTRIAVGSSTNSPFFFREAEGSVGNTAMNEVIAASSRAATATSASAIQQLR
jgi:hypothetical protein